MRELHRRHCKDKMVGSSSDGALTQWLVRSLRERVWEFSRLQTSRSKRDGQGREPRTLTNKETRREDPKNFCVVVNSRAPENTCTGAESGRPWSKASRTVGRFPGAREKLCLEKGFPHVTRRRRFSMSQ